MAKYGFGVYGIPKYGELEGNRLYYSANIFGWAYDYKVVSLTWQSIISDPEDIPYVPVRWRLVRSYSGVPDNPYVGDILDSGVLPGDFRLTYIDDSDSLLTNQEVTYVLWVFTAEVNESNQIVSYENSRWVNCGSTSVNVVEQSDMQSKFKRWLPAAWLNESLGTGELLGEVEDGLLAQTIDAYGFAYDKLKTDAVLLGESNNPAKIPSKLLKNKVTELGFLYEPSLGDTYHRSIYKTGNTINSLKGTPLGISTYVTALSHWGCIVNIGKNLFLDYNDASFEEGVGRWGFANTNATITQQKYLTSLADLSVTLTPPTTPMINTEWPMREIGCGVVTVVDNSAVRELKLIGTPVSNYLIPVVEGKEYVFKGWVRHLTDSGNISVKIDWVNSLGNAISSSTASPSLTTTTSWQEIRSNVVTAPNNSYYANVTISISASANDLKFVFDKFDFREFINEFSSSGYLPSYSYEDARAIDVKLIPDSVNYILNPSFDSGTSWWQGLNADVVQSFTAPATAKIFGSAVAKVTARSTDIAALVSDWQVIPGAKGYLVSAYVSGPVGKTAVLRIEYSSRQSYEEQGVILTDEEGKYYPTDAYYVDSAPLTLSATATRLSTFAVSPVISDDFSKPLVKVSVYFPTAEEDDIFYVDSVMLIEGNSTEDYFQGNGGLDPIDPNINVFYASTDCNWEKRKQLNLVTNSAFSDTEKWTAVEGTTFTVSTSNPLFGTKRGNVSASGGGAISTTVYYPGGACIGGEDLVISAYVKNVAGTYSIETSGQAKNSFKVSSSDASSWTRIDVPRVAGVGETNFTITISLSDAGSGVKVFHVDGVQAEFGRVATPFIDPSNQSTTVSDNPAQAGETVSYAYSAMTNAGYSFYGTRYLEKYERLSASISLVTPLGSSYLLSFEKSLTDLEEIPNSLLPSSSFELTLKGWNGVNALIKKSLSRGTLFDEILTQGAAFCKVSAASSGTFGIETDLLTVTPVTGYYTSIAVKPENEDAYGTYKLKLKWYAESQGLLREKISTVVLNRHDRWAYLDIVAPGNKTVTVVGASVVNNYITITTAGEHKFSVGEDLILVINNQVELSGPMTIEAITPTTFSFTRPATNLAQTTVIGSASFSNTGVAFASIEVLCEPYSPGAGVTFHLDKVIFRE
jgi:hypothetical protein